MRPIDADQLLTKEAEGMVGKYAFDLMKCLIEDTPTIYGDLEGRVMSQEGYWRYTFEKGPQFNTSNFIPEYDLAEICKDYGKVLVERIPGSIPFKVKQRR